MPWYVRIILISIFLGIAIAVYFLRVDLFEISGAPGKLPSPPGQSETLLGIRANNWFEAAPHIQTIEGDVYSFQEYSEVWQLSEPADSLLATPCSPETQRLIEESAGETTSCLVAQPDSEWCPAPEVSFAIDHGGDVWKHERHLRCTPNLVVGFPIFAIAGLVLGVYVSIYVGAAQWLSKNWNARPFERIAILIILLAVTMILVFVVILGLGFIGVVSV